jgi:putative membrane protein
LAGLHRHINLLQELDMKLGLLVGACVLLSAPAWAQSVGEKTGVNSTLGITPKTSDFVHEAAMSDMFEIESSKLAASKATGDVQSFANQMVTDHAKTTTELKPLALQAHVTLPTQMSSSQRRMVEKLRQLNGHDFTNQYVTDQVSAHKDAVSLFQRYSDGGDNPQIKSWAGQTVPTLQHHLDMAQGLEKITTGSR